MKLTYKKQLLLSVGIVLLFNILTSVLKHWIYHSIGYVLCGLLWVINPVMFGTTQPNPTQKMVQQITGFLLILLGILSRAHYY